MSGVAACVTVIHPCDKMSAMQQQQPEVQPIYWDNHRVSVNLTMIFALAVALLGLISGSPLLFAGLGVAGYTWLTSPRRYLIFENALVIEYGRPRVKVVDFSNISHVEMLSLGIGERLRVVLINGRRIMVMSKNLETFRERLDEALERYQSQYPQGRGQDDGTQDDQRGRIIDAERGPDYEGPSER